MLTIALFTQQLAYTVTLLLNMEEECMCSREKVPTLSPHKSVEADIGGEMICCCCVCVIRVNTGAVRLWADWKKNIP